MSGQGVTIDEKGVKLSLAKLVTALGNRRALLAAIGAGQLVSVRRTFREQGSPADSWAPLADSTKRKAGSKASAGRKILILSGRLLNSIHSEPTDTGVSIGTNLVYARVQQEGSSAQPSKVGRHQRSYLKFHAYQLREVTGRDGKLHRVPVGMTTHLKPFTSKRGKVTVKEVKFTEPRTRINVQVSAHERTGGIPARPYLVFRPEDPARIREQVAAFTTRCVAQAGLAGGV